MRANTKLYLSGVNDRLGDVIVGAIAVVGLSGVAFGLAVIYSVVKY
jgi:hypothetical protein